ncbi:MAG: hypothetical protein K2H53_05535 [Clostridia bacterium]|nr:hypothetical protein [Clostridia bacterium]
MKGVVYRTKNIIVQKIQKGEKNDRCYIIGTGNSLNITCAEIVYNHDPGMREFKPNLDKDYTVYAFYITFGSASLEKAPAEIADFVDNLQNNNHYHDIVLVGHYICGICAAMSTEICKTKVNLVTISTPFFGTIMADKETAEKVLKLKPFIFMYRKIFNNHNVDKDITPEARLNSGVPKISCKQHINIMSEFSGIIDCKDVLDLFLLFLDRYMRINGNGIVPMSSQAVLNAKTIKIFSSHAHSLEDGLKIIEEENLI